MRKFLIQCDSHKRPLYDFCYAMVEAERYFAWKEDDTFRFIYVEHPKKYASEKAAEKVVPVGSVEFVREFVRLNYGEIAVKEVIRPVYPSCWLGSYMGNMDPTFVVRGMRTFARKIVQFEYNRRGGPISAILDKKYHLKHDEVIKHPLNGDYPLHVLRDRVAEFEGEPWHISDTVSTVNEWRVFVHNHAIVGVKQYKGDYNAVFPLIYANKLIKDYEESPGSNGTWAEKGTSTYTLDIGEYTNTDGENDVNTHYGIVEFHEFYSCGLYGFDDWSILPYMYSQQWFRILRRIYAVIH